MPLLDICPKGQVSRVQPTYDLGLFISEGGVEEDLFDTQGVA